MTTSEPPSLRQRLLSGLLRRRGTEVLSPTGFQSAPAFGARSAAHARYRELFKRLCDELFPSPCLQCDRVIRTTTGSLALGDLQLCPSCSAEVRWHARVRCRLCALRDRATFHTCCLPCLREPPPWVELFTLADYEPPLDRVLGAFKHHSMPALAKPLGQRCWEVHAERLVQFDALVPVPLNFWRQRQRGFNQSELLAREIGRRLGRPVLQPLRRSRGPALSQLSHEDRRSWARRTVQLRRQPSGAWRQAAARRFRGGGPARRSLPRKILLIDDVLTTGATAETCCRLLCRAGAREVGLLVVARTP